MEERLTGGQRGPPPAAAISPHETGPLSAASFRQTRPLITSSPPER